MHDASLIIEIQSNRLMGNKGLHLADAADEWTWRCSL